MNITSMDILLYIESVINYIYYIPLACFSCSHYAGTNNSYPPECVGLWGRQPHRQLTTINMHNYRSNPDIIGANALLPLMNEGVRSVGQSGPWVMEYDQQDPFDIPKY